MASGRIPKFLTLTQVAIPDESWRAALKRLRSALRKLRRCKAWTTNVGRRGWLGSIETTWSNGAWHVHIHCLVDANYWPQGEISEAWDRATGGLSRIVDVRRADKGTGMELAKYTLKAANVPMDRIAEYARQSRGVRLLSVGGAWLGAVKDGDDYEDAEEAQDWSAIPFPIVEAAAAGADWAKIALDAVDAWITSKGSLSDSRGRDGPSAARSQFPIRNRKEVSA